MITKPFRSTALQAVCCLSGLFCFFASARAVDSQDISAANYATLPGFKLEIVFKADPKENGSWISLGKDSQGRLMLGGQRHQPMTRLTLDGEGRVTKQEVLHLPVSEIMGQLYVNDSLYVNASGKDPAGKDIFGLFRLRDPKGDGSFDSVELLREWKHGAGEHGAHGIVLGPDKKHIFTVCGNLTAAPVDLAPGSQHKNFRDDLALPRAEDGNGFGVGKGPPGGFITRMNLDGKEPELYASGQRNTYDIAFNADGELFGFDSDMEDDWGTPWYRPIRVFHAVSAGEGGFREGSAKWPEYYADSLPAVVDIGLGCPTGVSFGYGAKFPAKYQKAFYITDWTYGRLIALDMKPHGASYESAGWENFVAPKGLHGDGPKAPLNLTDIVIGNDGALYFTIGGRNTQAVLFRVSYVGNEATAPADLHDAGGSAARELRHKIETFHGQANPEALAVVWPQLDNADRYIRYAARIAVEAQPVDQWKSKALAETRPTAALTALLALARLGGLESQPDLFKAVSHFSMASLSSEQQLDKLRVLEISITRCGKLSAGISALIVTELDAIYPAKSIELNRELCQVLLALGAPDAVAKTVKLLEAAPTQEEQIDYVLALRTIKDGWTPELHRAYLSWWTKDRRATPARHPDYLLKWFSEAGREYGDGRSYTNFIFHLHSDAVNSLSAEEAKSLADVIGAYVPPSAAPKAPAKPRKIVKEWKMDDLEPSLADVGHGRNFDRGKATFEQAQCLACHKFGNEGGAVGPDLTAVSSRFTRRDILESIILPSKVISEQFMNTEVRTKSGDVQVGRLVEETADHIVLQPDQLKPEKVTILKADIRLRRFSKVSPMPEGLVNTFGKDEILDLLAYLEAAGRRSHADFSSSGK